MKETKDGRVLAAVVSFLAFLLLIALDQYTKHLAVIKLKDGPDYVIAPGVLMFRYLENRGAAFGMLQEKRIVFIVIGIAFLIAAARFLGLMPPTRRFLFLRSVLVLIAAGAAGNLIDRAFSGYVVDFIYFSLIDFPIFNVADCYVTVGTVLLFAALLFRYDEDELSFFK